MKTEKVTCKEVMRHICDTLGEDLQSERCKEIRKHLEDCSGCRNYFKTVEITIDYYKKYNVKMPEGAHERLMKYLDLDDCD